MFYSSQTEVLEKLVMKLGFSLQKFRYHRKKGLRSQDRFRID
jgi:hypothetical protein